MVIRDQFTKRFVTLLTFLLCPALGNIAGLIISHAQLGAFIGTIAGVLAAAFMNPFITSGDRLA